MSSNFDFLRQYDKLVFKWAKEMERTLYKEPRSTLVCGGRVLEAIRNSLYRYHYKEITKNNPNIENVDKDLNISFRTEDLSKHITDLRHKNLIKKSFADKIVRAYNTRHTLHLNDYKDDLEVDKKAALKLYEEIFEIALLYCQHLDPEFSRGDYKFKLPSKELTESEVQEIKPVKLFDNCIICGKPNTISNRNFCPECKRKIRIAQDLEDLLEMIDGKSFTEDFLKKNRYDKFEIKYIIHFLREFELISSEIKNRDNKNEYYLKDFNRLYDFIDEVQEYEDAEKILIAFYNNIIDSDKIDTSENSPYKLGEKGGSFKEFYNLIIDKKVKYYLNIKSKNKYNTFKDAKVTEDEVKNWYLKQLNEIQEANYKKECDISFTKMSKILMAGWIKYRKQGFTKSQIKDKLNINNQIIDFWFDRSAKVVNNYPYFKDFFEDNRSIVMKLFVDAIIDGKSKKEAMEIADIDDSFIKDNFDLVDSSKIVNKFTIRKQQSNKDQFLRFKKAYFDDKIKVILNNLNGNTLEYALQEAQLSLNEFNEWYNIGKDQFFNINKKEEFNKFYVDVTRILFDNWLDKRKDGIKKVQAFEEIGINPNELDDWFRFKEFKFQNSYFGEFEECDNELFNEFYLKHDSIIMDLIQEAIENGFNKDKIAKYADIDVGLIDYIYKLGEEGNENYLYFVETFEGTYVNKRLDKFLDIFDKKKDYDKAIKGFDLSKEFIEDAYALGKEGNERYSEFYQKFLEVQLKVYSYLNITKNERVALRRSNLTKNDIKFYNNEVETLTLFIKMNMIISGTLSQKKIDAIAKKASVTVGTIFDWYLKGKDLITKDEYLTPKEISDLGEDNLFTYAIHHENYQFNNTNSLDYIYKIFYNTYHEIHVKIKTRIISKNYDTDMKFMKFMFKEISVTEREFKFWDKIGLINRDFDEDDEEEWDEEIQELRDHLGIK